MPSDQGRNRHPLCSVPHRIMFKIVSKSGQENERPQDKRPVQFGGSLKVPFLVLKQGKHMGMNVKTDVLGF